MADRQVHYKQKRYSRYKVSGKNACICWKTENETEGVENECAVYDLFADLRLRGHLQCLVCITSDAER